MAVSTSTIYRIVISPTEFVYKYTDDDGATFTESTYKRIRLVAPKRAILEVISPERYAAIAEPKWYVVCENCGEAFDDLVAAVGHDGESDDGFRCYEYNHAHEDFDIRPTYRISREHEAM